MCPNAVTINTSIWQKWEESSMQQHRPRQLFRPACFIPSNWLDSTQLLSRRSPINDERLLLWSALWFNSKYTRLACSSPLTFSSSIFKWNFSLPDFRSDCTMATAAHNSVNCFSHFTIEWETEKWVRPHANGQRAANEWMTPSQNEMIPEANLFI